MVGKAENISLNRLLLDLSMVQASLMVGRCCDTYPKHLLKHFTLECTKIDWKGNTRTLSLLTGAYQQSSLNQSPCL